MKAIELSRLTGTSVHTIRYYQRVGLLKVPRNRSNGYHEFSAQHAGLLAFIRRSRGAGLSLAQIRTFIAATRNGRARCPSVSEIVRNALPAVELDIARRVALRNRMKTFMHISRRRPQGTPTGKDVRRLIESLSAAATHGRASSNATPGEDAR